MSQHRQLEHLMGTACSTGGADSATKIVSGVGILENDILRRGIDYNEQNLTIYENDSTCRVAEGSTTGNHRILFCGSMPDGTDDPEITNSPLSPAFLRGQMTHAFQGTSSAQTQVVTNVIGRTESKGQQSTKKVNKIMTQRFIDQSAETIICKTENFQQWLASAIDRLHDIREFLPGSVVRAVLYNNFTQDFIQEPLDKAKLFVTYLSDFFEVAFGPGANFWGTYNSVSLTFEQYWHFGGPPIEIDPLYTAPPPPTSVEDIKHILMITQVDRLKALGIPLIKITDNESLLPSRPYDKLNVQAINKLNIPHEDGDVGMGTVARFWNIGANKLKVLWAEAESMKMGDQLFIDIDGITLFLFVDAFKRPMITQTGAFLTSSKTFIAYADRANAKLFGAEGDQQSTATALSQVSNRYLFPQAGETREFTFNRVSAINGVDSIETMQKATITYPSTPQMVEMWPNVKAAEQEAERELFSRTWDAIASQEEYTDKLTACINVIINSPSSKDLDGAGSLCNSLHEMLVIRQKLSGVESRTHDLDGRDCLVTSSDKKCIKMIRKKDKEPARCNTKPGSKASLHKQFCTTHATAHVQADKSRLLSMAEALLPEERVNDIRAGIASRSADLGVNALLATAILDGGTDIQQIEKTNDRLPPNLSPFLNVTSCPNWYFAEVGRDEEENICIYLPNGEKYYPCGLLSRWDLSLANKFENISLSDATSFFLGALTIQGQVLVDAGVMSLKVLDVHNNSIASLPGAIKQLTATNVRADREYIPLATVMYLEEQILNIIASNTVQLLKNQQKYKNGTQILKNVGNYVKEHSHSLNFLDKFKGAFLTTTLHHEAYTFNGWDERQSKKMSRPKFGPSTHEKEKTATAASHIFHPNGFHANPGLLEYDGVDGDGQEVRSTERIDRTTKGRQDVAPSLADAIERMDDDQILQALIVASMTVTEDPDYEAEADDDGARKDYDKDDTTFIRLGSAISGMLNEIIQVFIPGGQVQHSHLANPIFSDLHERTVHRIKTFVWNKLDDFNSNSGMVKLIELTCRHIRETMGEGGMGTTPITAEGILRDILTETIRMLFEEAQQEILKKKDLLINVSPILVQQWLERRGVDKIQAAVVCDTDSLAKDWAYWQHYRGESHSTVNINSDDDDEEEEEIKYVFKRGILGEGTEHSPGLLKSMFVSMEIEKNNPNVYLVSGIRVPQTILDMRLDWTNGIQFGTAVADNPVSVTEVHKAKYIFYQYLFDAVLFSNSDEIVELGKATYDAKKKPPNKDKGIGRDLTKLLVNEDKKNFGSSREKLYWVFKLWKQRMIIDEKVTVAQLENYYQEDLDTEKKIQLTWVLLFIETISDAIKRRNKTNASGITRKTDADDDDDGTSGGPNSVGIHMLTCDKIIDFTRSLDGISDVRKGFDKSQRCLQFCIKSIAYSITNFGIFGSQNISITQQGRMMKIFIEVFTPVAPSCITYCVNVRAEEGLKSWGDRAPLETADFVNSIYGRSSVNGTPKAEICGGISFDKQLTVVGHTQGIPAVMLSIKGEVLCMGGFRGYHEVNPRNNHVQLRTNPSLVGNLSIEEACTDTYWIGDLRTDATSWHMSDQQYKNLKLLILLIGNIIKRKSISIWEVFAGNIIKNKNSKEGTYKVINEGITYLESLNKNGEVVTELNALDKSIDTRMRLQMTTVTRCAAGNNAPGNHQLADLINRKVNNQQSSRKECIHFLTALDPDVDKFLLTTQAHGSSFVTVGNQLTTSSSFQPDTVMGTVVGTHAQTVPPGIVMGTVVPPDAGASEDSDIVMGTVMGNEERYKQWVVDVQKEYQSLRLGKVYGMNRREKNQSKKTITNLINEGKKLEKIYTGSDKRYVLDAGLHKISVEGEWLLEELQKQGGRGVKSRKRRPRRRRKTRRKKKRRKRKTIRKRRKRGRKTRRK